MGLQLINSERSRHIWVTLLWVRPDDLKVGIAKGTQAISCSVVDMRATLSGDDASEVGNPL
jgi:hypothetical protein